MKLFINILLIGIVAIGFVSCGLPYCKKTHLSDNELEWIASYHIVMSKLKYETWFINNAPHAPSLFGEDGM